MRTLIVNQLIVVFANFNFMSHKDSFNLVIGILASISIFPVVVNITRGSVSLKISELESSTISQERQTKVESSCEGAETPIWCLALEGLKFIFQNFCLGFCDTQQCQSVNFQFESYFPTSVELIFWKGIDVDPDVDPGSASGSGIRIRTVGGRDQWGGQRKSQGVNNWDMHSEVAVIGSSFMF